MKTRLCFLNARACGHARRSFVLKALPAAAALVFAQASGAVDIAGGAGLPQNGTVFYGSASGSVAGNQLTVNQASTRAVIDWTSFNIDASKAVQFVQPGVSSAVLNRVNGDANPTQILGSLSANGSVMLMNPNGVMFGANSVVNVGSLIATTGTIDANNFINTGGALITGATGGITNQGALTAQNAGLVALVAPSVSNQGSIVATGGTVALAGTTAATVSLNGGLYEFAIPAGATGTAVTNAAGASLNGASILLGVGDAANLVSGVINLEGVQQASNRIVVNGDSVVLKSALQAPSVSGNSNRIDVYNGARIQDAVGIAKTGTPGSGAAVNVKGGTYGEQVVLNKANLTLTGSDGALIVVPDSGQTNGISINANNVTVTGMEISGPVNQSWLLYPWGNNISRGVAVSNGVTGFNISNNNIHDVRNGILIDGRNTGSVTGNRIENTKGAISVQYTDGAGIAISGNTQGSLGNEWGLNLHLNGYWDGSTIRNNPIAAAPTLAWQQGLLDLASANGGWAVQDQGYTSSNRTQVNVATTGSSANQGSLLKPLASIQGGVDAVVSGGLVNVAGGTYVQPATLRVNKALTLAGAGQAATTIDARSVNGYGINVTADNVTLRDFTLYGPSANAAASYGIKVAPLGDASARLRNFAITDVTIRGSGRAELDLNGVDGAWIDSVTANGAPVGNDAGSTAGAGIQLTDSANITVRNSTTRNNAWGGLALYQSNRYYNQQTSMITVGGGNHFTEINPVFMQDESASQNFGPLSIAGFDFAVRNSSSTNNAFQYTWLQTFEQQALDFAVNLGASASSSYVQAWNGAAAMQNFVVGTGNLLGGGTQALSVNTALGQAASGATIQVRAGSYAEDVVANNPYNFYFGGATLHSLTFNAPAGGSGIAGAVTADGAGGILFNAPVRLLGDTTLATAGADITLNGDIQNAGGTARALRLAAGSGSTRGNVHMATGGSESDALGQFDVLAGGFSLADTLWVKGYAIDALRNVTLSGHTLRAQDAAAVNTLNAGGDVSGSTINQGSVQITSGGDITANIAGNNVTVQALGDLNVVVNAAGSAALAGDTIVASVVAPVVTVQAQGDAQISGASPNITVDAPSGQVSGSFGQVTNAGGGLVNVNGRPQANQTLSANTENNRVVPGSNTLADNAVPEGGQPVQVAIADLTPAQAEALLDRVGPDAAGDAVGNGDAVEIDLSPRNGRQNERQKKPAK